MKRFGAIVTICFIVLSTLTPLWGTKTVLASQENQQNELNNGEIPDIQKVFGNVSGKETTSAAYLTNQITVTPKQARETIALIEVSIQIAGKPAADSDPTNVFGKEDVRGDWNAIIDDDLEFDQAGEGIYLDVFGVPQNTSLGLQSNENYQQIESFDQNLTATWKPVYPKNQKLPTGQQEITDANTFKKTVGTGYLTKVPYTSYNIGSHFWRTNPTSDFFGKKTISALIPLEGLKPSTDYYIRVRVGENQGDSFGASSEVQYNAMSKITPQTTVTTTAQNSGNGNPNEILDQSGISAGSSEEGATVEEIGKTTIYGQKIGCSLTPTFLGGEGVDLTGCFIKLYWDTLYTFSAWVLRGAAGLMDTFMAISLSSAMYKNSFIETGWTVVRDVCNIFFIFILLWTAFKMVINSHHFNAQKTIVNVVIIGLLINFSLFFSRVIIDMGNISARVFYNQIRITGGKAQESEDAVAKAIATKDIHPKAISGALADGLSFGTINTVGYDKINEGTGLNYGTIFLLITLNIIVNLVAMWVFIKVAFAFLGRVLSLWVGMIMSPFAFTSTIIDGGGHGGGPLDIKKLGWTDWLRNMLESAFYPALYLFFVFLIIILIQSNFAGAIIADAQTLDATPFLIMTLFKFMFIIGLLIMSADFAKKMSGTFGGGLTDFVGKAAGFLGGAAVGVATGGLAMAGSKVLGSRAAAMLGGEKGNELRATATSSLEQLRANPANSGKTDAQLLKMQDKAKEKLLSLDKRANASYDARQAKIFGVNPMQGLSNITGLNFNAGTAGTRLGVDSTAGGYQGAKDRKAAKDNEKDEKFKKILGDKKLPNGMSVHDAEEKKKDLESELEDFESMKKADSTGVQIIDPVSNRVMKTVDGGLTGVEAELERIEKAIKESKDSRGGTADPTLLAEREMTKEAVKNRKADLQTQAITAGVLSRPPKEIEREVSSLSMDIKKSKDGYAKDYLRNKIFERQREVGGLEDHHHNSTADSFRRGFFSSANLSRIAASMGAGAVAGTVVAGPLGAVVGTVAGALGGGRLSTIQGILRSIDRRLNSDLSGARSYGAATHDISAGHVHAPHGHADYHTPHGAWIEKLFSGGGLGGGGGSHGGGDHGHGGGGGHH